MTSLAAGMMPSAFFAELVPLAAEGSTSMNISLYVYPVTPTAMIQALVTLLHLKACSLQSDSRAAFHARCFTMAVSSAKITAHANSALACLYTGRAGRRLCGLIKMLRGAGPRCVGVSSCMHLLQLHVHAWTHM